MNRLKWTIGILELLRELHAKLDSNSDPELPTNANSVINTTEYGGCDDPCDANESNCHQSYGNYQGLLPPGSGGCGHGGGLGNGKQPVRDDGEPDANASKGGLKGDPEAIENALPCVFCFFGLRADLTRDCRTRKRYISLLWYVLLQVRDWITQG